MKKIKTKYEVVEDRGSGIVYTRFHGDLDECWRWLKDNCWYDEHTNDYYSLDSENVNGNNDPFTYDIIIEEDE